MGERRLLLVYRGELSATKSGLALDLERAGFAVDSLAVPERARFHGIPATLGAARLARYDLVVTADYFTTWAMCLRLRAVSRRTRLIALGFNQSSSRLLLTGRKPLDRLANRIWRRASAFIVHSHAEADLFAAAHDISSDRFVFSHWGYDLPAFTHGTSPRAPGGYVSMIGRNNRDVATFCKAVDEAGTEGVLITSAYVVAGRTLDVPPSVTLLLDRPMEECLAVVAGSFAHLVLLVDGGRGAGHISSVSAMLLGKPQVFSGVPPIADYLVDGVNGLAVPIGDAGAVATAIRRLRDDPALAVRLGQAGRRFALAELSHAAATARIAAVAHAVADDAPLPCFPASPRAFTGAADALDLG